MTRIIFHIDVNSAYLSWTAVSLLKKGEPIDLRTIPSIIGGSIEDRHGIVLAKSTSAKKHGIVTGEPIIQAMQKCPNLIAYPPDFALYSKCSRAMFDILSEYSDRIEPFSIDEGFLDYTGMEALFGPPIEAAKAIQKRILAELGFTVNVGISSNKLLAKMASDFEKPDKTHTLFPSEIPDKMWPLPLRSLFFVGSSAALRMEKIGLHTIGDIASCDCSILKAHLGDKYGTLIHRYANGIDDSPVEEREPLNKGYGNSITLPQDISDYSTACQVLLALSETVGARLRESHVRCTCVCVELKDWQFHSHSHQAALPYATDSTTLIYQKACQLLKEFWDFTPVRLIGLRTSRIDETRFHQMNLFETEQSRRMNALEKAVDSIRDKYGVDSIKRASFLEKDLVVDHTVSKKKHLKQKGEPYQP